MYTHTYKEPKSQKINMLCHFVSNIMLQSLPSNVTGQNPQILGHHLHHPYKHPYEISFPLSVTTHLKANKNQNCKTEYLLTCLDG